VGKDKARAPNKVPKNPKKNHFMSKKLMKYGSKVMDMVELWHHCESQFPDLQHDMEEEGPLLLECAFRKFGATPVDYNSETDVDTHHNDQNAYMKYASAVTSLKMTRKQFTEIMHEAEEMVEMCTDGNANIGFISNLFRFLSIYLYIYEKIKFSFVGKFIVITWYDRQCNKNPSFLNDIEEFKKALVEELKLLCPEDRLMRKTKIRNYSTSYNEFRRVFEVLELPLTESRKK
jgi:hypothetical protein